MKSIVPWFCLVAVASANTAFANEGLDYYRVGYYKDAATLFDKTPNRDPIVDYYMGRMRLYGYGELKDNAQAMKYFRQSALKGFLPAQNIMARYTLLHENNPEQALTWFKLAADQDDIQAQMYCASAYMFGFGTKKNSDMARRYYIAAARNGNSIAQYALAENFLSGRQANKTMGLIWLNKSVAQGNPDAELLLARLYANGKFVDQDINKALAMTRVLADKNYAPAQYQMAEFEKSLNNLPQAKEWYTKAGKQQYHPAELALAKLYLQEKSPLYNPHEGFLQTLTAAEEGSTEAQFALANMYKTGVGVDKDDNLAIEWQQKAKTSEKNSSTAMLDAIHWLSQGKSNTFVECGYAMPGILSAWQNQYALKENTYNQAPKMSLVRRDKIFTPDFVMISPDQIAITEYYDALLRATAMTKPTTFKIPRYSFELLPNQASNHPVANKGEEFDYLQHVQPGMDQASYEALFKKIEGRAILGDSVAQFDLGQLYQHGVGVTKNIEQAIKFYTLASQQQDLRAEYNLGLIYLEGQELAADYDKAMLLLRDAAFKGNPYAQYVVASIDEQGYRNLNNEIVIQPDLPQAVAMYDLAASNNFGLAQFRLAQILAHEQPEDISVEAMAKRHSLIKSLYQGAVKDGVTEAALPLAFYNAMDANKAKQADAVSVAIKAAKEGNQEAALLLGLLYDRGIGVGVDQSEAIQWYQKAGANPVSSFILGSYFSQGIGVDKDPTQGKDLLTKAAQAGFSYANFNLAILNHQNNESFLPELNKALELGNSKAGLLLADYFLALKDNNVEHMVQARDIYERFADKGDKFAQFKLGFMLEHGLGGLKDVVVAEQLYRASAEQGDQIGQFLLGQFYQLGHLDGKPNYDEAKKWYGLAQQRFAPAAVNLGFVYDTVDDDYEKALQSFEIAANAQDPIGQYDLALMYEQGKGRPVDYVKAQTSYQNAANLGYAPAMVSLAELYFNGLAGNRDENEALHWYKKAAELGDREALYQLGLLSETGVATKLDYAEAIRYYQEAAKTGDSNATLALARMYQYGLGVSKDLQRAETLYQELAEQGNAYAQYQLALIYSDSSARASDTKRLLLQAQDNGSQQARKTLQWMSAQKAVGVSFIEPVPLNPLKFVSDQSAELMYLDALNAWNHGDEVAFRMILGHILGQYPNYLPAKRAYEQLTPVSLGAWG